MISDVKAGIGNHFMARIGNNTQFKILNSSIIRYNLENFHDIIGSAEPERFMLHFEKTA